MSAPRLDADGEALRDELRSRPRHATAAVRADEGAVELELDLADLVLRDDRALVEVLVPQLGEVLGPHEVVVLVPAVPILRVAELEPVEVGADGGDGKVPPPSAAMPKT